MISKETKALSSLAHHIPKLSKTCTLNSTHISKQIRDSFCVENKSNLYVNLITQSSDTQTPASSLI